MRPDFALYWMRTHYPTILEEKRRLRFNTLTQDNLPIKQYIQNVQRVGRLLNFPESVVNDQIFRGLSPDNIVEVEKVGIERLINEIGTILD